MPFTVTVILCPTRIPHRYKDNDEYEGLTGGYRYEDGVLKDSDGDPITVRLLEGRNDGWKPLRPHEDPDCCIDDREARKRKREALQADTDKIFPNLNRNPNLGTRL